MTKINFKPENTAIVKGNSASAVMLINDIAGAEKILDYGCGAGRNIKYILDNTANIIVHGTDIVEQLEKEKERHDQLRGAGCTIEASEQLEKNSYDKILNSHVLNVIESDEVKSLVVKDIYDKLKEGGKAYFEVRTKRDVESSKTKEVYGDGYKIKKGNSFTYQEALTKEKITLLLEGNGFNIVDHICNSSKHIITAVK